MTTFKAVRFALAVVLGVLIGTLAYAVTREEDTSVCQPHELQGVFADPACELRAI